jgi:hypothetical protein
MADKKFEILDGAIVSGNAEFDTNVLFVDATNNRVGVNKTPAQGSLDVSGLIYGSANVEIGANYYHGDGSELSNMPYLSNNQNSTLGDNAIVTLGTGTSSGYINVDSGHIMLANDQSFILGDNGSDSLTFTYSSTAVNGAKGLGISGDGIAIDTDLMIIYPDINAGNRGITVNTTYDQTSSYVADFKGDFRTTGNIDATGDITAYASDIKLKTNLEVVKNSLQLIDQIEAYYFEWNKQKCEEVGFTPNRDAEHGVIAQEIEKIMPDLVVNSAFSDEYKTVRYDRLTVLLLAAVKDLKKEIEDLKSKMCCQ